MHGYDGWQNDYFDPEPDSDYDPLADAIAEDSLTAKCGHWVECTEICGDCGRCQDCCTCDDPPESLKFGTLEEMVKFQDENKETYMITFGADRANLYLIGNDITPVATVYDDRCGAIATKLLKSMIRGINW